MPTFEVPHPRDGDVLFTLRVDGSRVRMTGELCYASAGVVRREFDALASAPALEIDTRSLSFVDLFGMRALEGLVASAAASGVEIHARWGVRVRRIVDLLPEDFPCVARTASTEGVTRVA
jgi:anti-anti-sigma regulatory factor